jgi:hypothetical protein
MTDTVVPLTKPIKAHGDEVSSLTLREPTAEDVMEIGYPYLIVTGDDKSEAIELRPKIVGRYVVKLAKIPLSSVKEMSIPDLQTMQAVVMGFFGQTPDATSKDSKTEPSNSPTSGT